MKTKLLSLLTLLSLTCSAPGFATNTATRSAEDFIPTLRMGMSGIDLDNHLLSTSSLAGSFIKANQVTAAQIAKDVVQHDTIALASADILALSATPKTLVAAVASKTIIVHRIVVTMVSTSTQYASGGAVVARYNTDNTAVINTIAAAVVNAAAGTSSTIRQGLDVTGSIGKAVELTNATGAFTTGTGTATVDIWYSVL